MCPWAIGDGLRYAQLDRTFGEKYQGVVSELGEISMWISKILISKCETSNQVPKHTSKINEIEHVVSENDPGKDINKT